MTELEKIANRSWEENNTISIEADNEDAYKAGYITGFKKCFELNEGVEVENERLKAIILGLKAGKDMNVPTKWHNCKDGDYPENNQVVLVYTDWDGFVIKQYDSSRKRFGELCFDAIIAWQPLPEPPEEDQKKCGAFCKGYGDSFEKV